MRDIRILIADDDPGMRLVMHKIVDRAEGYVLLGEAKDGKELIELYDQETPDVVFMDVEMPGMTGLECAQAIQDRNPKTALIFATAHEEYMKDAFQYYAFDFLVKPFKVERALNTLARIRNLLTTAPANEPLPVKPGSAAGGPARLMIKHREGVSFVDIASILLVQREERSTVIDCMNGQRFITGDSLADIEKRLPKERFFRCHKSYIINIDQIDSITPYGRWTYIVKLCGTSRDALITHERFDELQKLFS